MYHLIATQDFGNYRRGDRIEADAEISRILDGEHHQHVVKVNKPDEPKVIEPDAPEPKPAEQPKAVEQRVASPSPVYVKDAPN